jgi:hypothetical protein
MATLDSFAAPNAHPIAHSPTVLSPASEDVLAILLGMAPDQAVETIEHSLDYGLLSELREEIAVRSSLFPEKTEQWKTLYDALTAQIHRLMKRRKIAASAAFAKRIEAERVQSDIDREHDERYPPDAREVQRRFAADDLLRKCAVFYDLETYPAGTASCHLSRGTKGPSSMPSNSKPYQARVPITPPMARSRIVRRDPKAWVTDVKASMAVIGKPSVFMVSKGIATPASARRKAGREGGAAVSAPSSACGANVSPRTA